MLFYTMKRYVFKIIFNHRVPAGVLQLTLGISVVIAVLCASMILLVHYTGLRQLEAKIKSDLADNATSGIHYLVANRDQTEFHQPLVTDLFNEGIDSVRLERRPWGLFELLISDAFRGKHHLQKAALVAPLPGNLAEVSVYMPENNSQVYLAGDARLEGDVMLPERGLATGYVDGRGFEGRTLLNGNFKKSGYHMPELDTLLLGLIKPLLNQASGGYLLYAPGSFRQASFVPFSSDTTYFYSQADQLEVSDTLRGNILVHSLTKVLIQPGAYLDDVLVVAPEIEVQAGFVGRAQLFAQKLITIGEGSRLNYPSSLVLFGPGQDSLIRVQAGAVVEGIVVIQGIDQYTEGSGVFRIEREGMFHGFAYVNGASDIQGNVRGHLTTRRLQALVKSTYYSSHIVDGSISSPARSPHMPASFLWGNGKQLAIARWIQE